jgi:hypothetical protein
MTVGMSLTVRRWRHPTGAAGISAFTLWTVLTPTPRVLATFSIPSQAASCLQTVPSTVVLTFGGQPTAFGHNTPQPIAPTGTAPGTPPEMPTAPSSIRYKLLLATPRAWRYASASHRPHASP